MSDDKYDIMREIQKGQTEKVALEAANEKAKEDFARELLEVRPEICDFAYAFTRKKPLKLRLKEKKDRIMTKIKATLGVYDKQEF